MTTTIGSSKSATSTAVNRLVNNILPDVLGKMDEDVSEELKLYMENRLASIARRYVGIEGYKEESEINYVSVINRLHQEELLFEIERGMAQARKTDSKRLVITFNSPEEHQQIISIIEKIAAKKDLVSQKKFAAFIEIGEIQIFASSSNTMEEEETELKFAEANERAVERAKANFLGVLPTIYRKLVQTPHPTEVISRAAIEAERLLVKFLTTSARFLFSTNPADRLNGQHENVLSTLKARIADFCRAVNNPPSANMTINNEMARSYKQSEHLYDSLMVEASSIVKAMQSIDPSFGSEGIDIATLKMFGNLLDSHTWSPGDADSKPQFNAEEMVNGIVLNKEAIERRYIVSLAEIAANTDNEALKDQAYEIMWKRMDMNRDIYIEHPKPGHPGVRGADEYAQERMGKFISYLESEIKEIEYLLKTDLDANRRAAETERLETKQGIHRELSKVYNAWEEAKTYRTKIKERYVEIEESELRLLEIEDEIFVLESEIAKGLDKNGEKQETINRLQLEIKHIAEFTESHRDFILGALGNGFRESQPKWVTMSVEKQGYEKHQDFMDDLGVLKESCDEVGMKKYRDSEGNETPLTIADSVHIGADNFGVRAQKGQLRQSGEFFDMAMKRTFDVLKDSKYKIDVKDSAELLHILNADKETDPDNYIKAIRIREVIYQNLSDVRKSAVQKQSAAADAQKPLKGKDAELAYYSEIYEMLRTAAENPDSYPLILVAECEGARNLLDVQAMLELITRPEEKARNPRMGTSMISPLLEYFKDIKSMREQVKLAMENPHFRAAQKERAEAHSSKLTFVAERTQFAYVDGVVVTKESLPAELREMKVIDIINNLSDQGDLQGHVIQALRKNFESDSDLQEKYQDDDGKPSWRKYFKNENVVDYIIMCAGSDSFKSASSSIKILIDQGFTESEAELAYFGMVLDRYIGTGSAAHRTSLIDALIRTRQGLEMREGPEIVAFQNIRVKAKKMMQLLGLSSEKTSLSPSAAVLNMGNFLNIREESSEVFSDIMEKSLKRIDQFQEKYESEDFAALTDFLLPVTLEKEFSLAARPPYRVGEGPENGPGTMRAIGFGQSLNNSAWGAVHLYYGLSEYLGADPKTGEFTQAENLDKIAEQYLKSPRTQDIINRANFNLSLSDRDMAWKFAGVGTGFAISRKGNDIMIDGESFNIRDLAASNSADDPIIERLRNTLEVNDQSDARKNGKKLPNIDQTIEAIRSAAITDVENQNAITTITSILAKVDKKAARELESADKTDPATLRKMLNAINPSLGTELEQKREAVDHARQVILEGFEMEKAGIEIKKSDLKIEDKTDERYKRTHKLSLAHATMKEIGENPPDVSCNPEQHAREAEQSVRAAA